MSVLAELADQWRFLPAETARKHLERAEALPERLSDESLYTMAWVVEQITGHRTEQGRQTQVVGAALRADMSALVQRLSERAGLRQRDLERGRWLGVEALCARWGVSRRTLERARRQGLMSRAVGVGGQRRVWYSVASIERLERARAAASRPAPARGRARLARPDEQRMIARAARVRRRFGARAWSVYRLARHLAVRFGTSVATARRVLGAAERLGRLDGPGAGRRPRASRGRAAELCERAVYWRGTAIGPGLGGPALAARLGRSRAGVRAALIEGRRRALLACLPEAWRTAEPADSGGTGPDELVTRVWGPEARATLGALGARGPTDAEGVLLAARRLGWPAAEPERARVWGMLRLRRLAARAARPPGRSEDLIDAGLTALLWDTRLRTGLALSMMAPALETARAVLGTHPAQTDEPARSQAVRVVVRAVIGAIERALGPPAEGARGAADGPAAHAHTGVASVGGGGAEPRLTGGVTLAVHHAVTRWRRSGEGPASHPIVWDGPAVGDPPERARLEPPAAWWPCLAQLGRERARTVAARYGWLEPGDAQAGAIGGAQAGSLGGAPGRAPGGPGAAAPLPAAEIARGLGVQSGRVHRSLRRAWGTMRALAGATPA
ncbi:MAG: hypothetical protein C0475_03905 [Planctomyces sp.]|nr:hypothetical protein [Planctomyces sp.]